MEYFINKIGERLKQIRLKLELSQKYLADLLGINQKTISHWEQDRNEPNMKALRTLCSHFDINLNWLLTGEGEMFIQSNMVREKQAVYNPENNDEYVQLPFVAGRISAGSGLEPDNTINVRVAFRKDWISRHGSPKSMSLIKVSGDSMEPSLYSGDIVLVNHSRNYINPQGGIYAVEIDDSIIIKRLQAIYTTKKIRIISDNTKYKPIDVAPDRIHINGQVIWVGREIERV